MRKLIQPKYIARFLMDLDNKRMDKKESKQTSFLNNYYPQNMWMSLCEQKEFKLNSA